MLHCAPSPTPPYVLPSPTLPVPVLTRVQVAPQSLERQISSFSPPVPSHTVRGSIGSTMMAAPTVPFTAGFDDVPCGVMSSHIPAAGSLSQGSTGILPASGVATVPPPPLEPPPSEDCPPDPPLEEMRPAPPPDETPPEPPLDG